MLTQSVICFPSVRLGECDFIQSNGDVHYFIIIINMYTAVCKLINVTLIFWLKKDCCILYLKFNFFKVPIQCFTSVLRR